MLHRDGNQYEAATLLELVLYRRGRCTFAVNAVVHRVRYEPNTTATPNILETKAICQTYHVHTSHLHPEENGQDEQNIDDQRCKCNGHHPGGTPISFSGIQAREGRESQRREHGPINTKEESDQARIPGCTDMLNKQLVETSNACILP